jgi:hypothetical protein
MKLNVLERINLVQLLPVEGSFVTFRILTDLKKVLSFTEKELKEFKIEQKDGRIFWAKSKEVEIAIGEQASIIIKTALQKIDKEGKVNEGNISLFDKFSPEIGLRIEK